VGVDCADLACVMSDCSADVPYASPADLDLSQKQLALRTSARPTSWMLVRLERRVDNDIGVSDVDDVPLLAGFLFNTTHLSAASSSPPPPPWPAVSSMSPLVSVATWQ